MPAKKKKAGFSPAIRSSLNLLKPQLWRQIQFLKRSQEGILPSPSFRTASVVFWGHHRICSKSYAKRHRETRSAAFAGPKPLFERFGRPNVVAIEAHVLPAERSDVGEQLVGQRFALGAKFGRTATIGSQYRYSASKPLCYWFKGGMSPTKAARHTGLGRSTLYRDIQAWDHA
jgi:hypothetical protein